MTMSDGALSQDEIDALLEGGGGTTMGGDPAPDASGGGLSAAEKESFSQLLAEVVSAQSSNLSGLMGANTATINEPALDVPSQEELLQDLSEEVLVVDLDYTEGVTGRHFYIMNSDAATTLAGIVVGQEDVELNEMALEAVKEALSTITGVALTTFGDKLNMTIMPSAGESKSLSKGDIDIPAEGIIRAAYNVEIDDGTSLELIEIFELPLAKQLVQEESGQPEQAAASQPQANPMDMGFGAGQQNPAQQPQGGMQQGGMQQGGMQQAMGFQQTPPNVQSVQFPNLQAQGSQPDVGNISLLMDVYMEMTVELGRTKKPIKEILGMGEGTIIELDKLAGEPVDILVNHKLIATGEVVVIDENFGVRVTEIVSPTERLSEMG
jgi:flagellar motor switch protein FliN